MGKKYSLETNGTNFSGRNVIIVNETYDYSSNVSLLL